MGIFTVGEELLKHSRNIKYTRKDMSSIKKTKRSQSLSWLTKGKLLVTFSVVSKPTVRYGDLITLSWIIERSGVVWIKSPRCQLISRVSLRRWTTPDRSSMVECICHSLKPGKNTGFKNIIF